MSRREEERAVVNGSSADPSSVCPLVHSVGLWRSTMGKLDTRALVVAAEGLVCASPRASARIQKPGQALTDDQAKY